MKVSDCRLLSLPSKPDQRGTLTVVEAGPVVPFEPRRVYYLHGVPEGACRGAHAHRALSQIFIAAAGAFDVVLRDGSAEQRYHLDRPDVGLYVCPMVWHELENFSAGALCLVAASHPYDESDYFRDYHAYLAARGVAE